MKKPWIFVMALLFLVVLINFGTLSYLSSLVVEQVSINNNAIPLQQVIEDPNTNSKLKYQLAIVPSVLQFGDDLGFRKSNTYTSYIDLEREFFHYTISASKEYAFEPYYWTWPIIGALPYRGFQTLEEIEKEAQKLNELGYETRVGRVIAMSSLGAFDDPITSIMVRDDVTLLIDTIFHERVHQLFFKKDDVQFNENAAVLIASVATLDFLEQYFGKGSVEYQTHKDRIEKRLLFSRALNELYEELDELYRKPTQNKEEEKQRIIQKHRAKFYLLNTSDFINEPINNAEIIGEALYYQNLTDFYKIHLELGNNTKTTIAYFNKTAMT